MKSVESESKSLQRYNIIARILTDNPNAQTEDAIEWIQKLCKIMQVPSLKKLGLKKKEIPAAVEQSKKSSSMKGNPIALEDSELTEILVKAFN